MKQPPLKHEIIMVHALNLTRKVKMDFVFKFLRDFVRDSWNKFVFWDFLDALVVGCYIAVDFLPPRFGYLFGVE